MPSHRANGTYVYRLLLWGPQKEGKLKVFKFLNSKVGIAQTEIREFNEEDVKGRSFPLEIGEFPNSEFQLILIESMKGIDPLLFPLKGIDAILFLWDSRFDQWGEDLQSFKELLKIFGAKINSLDREEITNKIPLIIMVNNRETKDCHPMAKIREVLATAKISRYRLLEVNASDGTNVRSTFLLAVREAVPKIQEKETKISEKSTSFEYTFKILITGCGGIGKTVFLLRYSENSWILGNDMTIGANFKTIHTSVQLDAGKVASIITRAVDVGGEFRFQSLATEHAKGCDGAFIMVDVTDYDSFREVPLWLKAIRSGSELGMKLPVWIVVNKCDLPHQEVEEQVVSKYVQDSGMRGYTLTSVKDNFGVKEAWDALFRELIKGAADTQNAQLMDLSSDNKVNEFFSNLPKKHEVGSLLSKIIGLDGLLGYHPEYQKREPLYTLAQVGQDEFPAAEFLSFARQIEREMNLDKIGNYFEAIILAQVSARLRQHPLLAASNLIKCTKLLLEAGFGKAAVVTFAYAACTLLRHDRDMLVRMLDEDKFYEDLVAVDSTVMAFPLYLLDTLESTNEELDPLAGLRDAAEHVEDKFGISLRKVFLETIDWAELQITNPKIIRLEISPLSPAAGEENNVEVTLINQSSKDATPAIELRVPTCSFPETRVKEIIRAHSQKVVTLHPGISEGRHRSITARVSVYNDQDIRTESRAHEIILRAEDKPVSILNTEIQPKTLRKGTEAELVGKLENRGKSALKISVKTSGPGFELPQKLLKVDLPLGVSEVRVKLGKARSVGENQLRIEVQDGSGGTLTEVVEYFNVARSWKNIVGNVIKEVLLKIPI